MPVVPVGVTSGVMERWHVAVTGSGNRQPIGGLECQAMIRDQRYRRLQFRSFEFQAFYHSVTVIEILY